MKTILVVDSTRGRDISLDFGLDKKLYLRVAVHTAKAARVAINTVQFDIAIVGEVYDMDDPSGFLKELQQVIPNVFRTVGTAREVVPAYVELSHSTVDSTEKTAYTTKLTSMQFSFCFPAAEDPTDIL